jgi:hypothetical protein
VATRNYRKKRSHIRAAKFAVRAMCRSTGWKESTKREGAVERMDAQERPVLGATEGGKTLNKSSF